MFRLKRFAALLFPCISMGLIIEAENLGIVGKTWPIEEPDLFLQIASKLENYRDSDRLKEINADFANRVYASVHRPHRVLGIRRTTDPRVFFHDPTITLHRDIKTSDGKILASQGEQFNPLDYTPMNQRLLFFDGNDPEQVNWAKEQLRISKYQFTVSPILIDGPVIELSNQWGQQIYFDQRGVLTRRFQIQQVPARVSRDDNLLKIEEVKP